MSDIQKPTNVGLLQKSFAIIKNEGVLAFLDKSFSWMYYHFTILVLAFIHLVQNPKDFNKYKRTSFEPTARRELKDEPNVSIIIPFRDGLNILRACIESILNKTKYTNYKIVLVNNQSSDTSTLEYLSSLSENNKIEIISYNRPFNYSAIHNFVIENINTEYILLLNNDTEIITPFWLNALVSQGVRADVGAVGGLLLYPDGTVQHAGVSINFALGGANNIYSRQKINGEHSYRINSICEYSAVTGACLLTKKSLYNQIGGMDEENLPISFNDVDYCLKLREAGYKIIYNSDAVLYHHESYSRGNDVLDKAKRERLKKEASYLKKKWRNFINQDPFFSPVDYLF